MSASWQEVPGRISEGAKRRYWFIFPRRKPDWVKIVYVWTMGVYTRRSNPERGACTSASVCCYFYGCLLNRTLGNREQSTGFTGKVCMTHTVAETDGHLILITVLKQNWTAISDTITSDWFGKYGKGTFTPTFFLSMFLIVYATPKAFGYEPVFHFRCLHAWYMKCQTMES